MSAEPLPAPPGAMWDDGEPANLLAAAADALEWLRLLELCIDRGVWRPSQKDTRGKLRSCRMNLQAALNSESES